MSLSLRPVATQSQQQNLVLTPALQQAIRMLQLSRAELSEMVRDELLNNPLLEESNEMGQEREEPVSSLEMQEGLDNRAAQSAQERLEQVEQGQSEISASEASNSQEDGFDWERYLQQQQYTGSLPSTGVRPGEDLPDFEQSVSSPESLSEHLMWQARLAGFSAQQEQIAEQIIQNLSPAGYYQGPGLAELASQMDASVLEVEEVLRSVQHFDPISIGARNLSEALWIQIHNPDARIDDPLVATIVREHLPNLERRAYGAIARDTGEDLEEVYEAVKTVLALEPRPARAYTTETSQYVVPDVYIQKIGEEFVVTLNDDGLPRLRVSSLYASAMRGGKDAKEYITERLRSAQWLIRSIQQRQQTMMKVTRSILKFQRDFFEKGPQHLKPLVLKEVAQDIDMHESTVSRVTSNKYVHTAQGIFELKYFFNAGIRRSDGDELASVAVKHRLQKLVESEPAERPYSDQKLVELLAAEGIEIARRTVAKYREQLGLASSSRRRRLF